MKYFVSIASIAEQDITDALFWYEEQKPNLGLEFESEIITGVNRIIENPLKFQIRYSDVRVHFLDRFPFGIHYRIQENTILIFAVFHTSRQL